MASHTAPDTGEKSSNEIGRLLHPRSIAVLGASDNPLKLSGRPIDYLKRFGFAGRILPVNPTRSEVQGLPSFASLDDIDGEIDLAFVMFPAERAAAGVRACGERGIRFAIVGAAGFAEAGSEGAALQRDLTAAIRETGIRVLGPNCLGMVSVRDRAVATFASAFDEDIELHDGPVAFVSQSGAFGTFIFSEAQQTGLGISHYISTGNEADLTVADVLAGLVETDEAQVLMAYLEGVGGGRKLLDVARRAEELDKPLVLVKVGRSEAGVLAAQSHTASLAGEDAVFSGVMRQHGVFRVDGPEQLLDSAQLFATGRRAAGRRLTTVSFSGGAGAVMADLASAHRIEVRPWDETWQARMAAVIPAFGSPRNPIDLTPALLSDPDLLRRGLEVALEHPDTDMIAILMGNADNGADILVKAIVDVSASTALPIVVVWTGGSGRPRAWLREAGIPCYTDPGRAAAALGRLADLSLRPRPQAAVRPEDVDFEAARTILTQARAAGRTQLDEHESLALIAAYGVPCVRSRAVGTADEAVRAAAELGGEVAVKLLSHHVGHKTDIGGVRLGLSGDAAVRSAAQDLLRIGQRVAADDARLLVQQMVAGGTEIIVGAKHDAVFGPVVVTGLGGVLVDVLADSQVAAAPLHTQDATRMVRDLRGSAVLDGVRGQDPRDVGALAELVSRVSWLLADFAGELGELDINPVLVGAQGAVAVDCLAVLTSDSGKENA